MSSDLVNKLMFYHPMCKLINCYSMIINDITSKSCEQRLIIKGHIAMHKNLILSTLLQYFSDKTF